MNKKIHKILICSSYALLTLAGCNNQLSSSEQVSSSSSENTSSIISSSSSEEVDEYDNFDNKINVYFIIGQSNAVGYGLDTANQLRNSDSRFYKGFDNVLYFGNQERWSSPLNSNNFEKVKLGQGVDFNRSGAEIGIANALKDNGEMNAIIKCAWGATHLYPDTENDISFSQGTWTSPSYIQDNNVDLTKNQKIGRMYNWFNETAIKGLSILKDKGYQPVINGVWWMQGEAEMFSYEMASAYPSLLKNLIGDVRSDLSKISGYDCSKTPFVMGLPKWNTSLSGAPAFQNAVRNSMISVSDSPLFENVGYVDCMGLSQHDVWHFDAKGQKYLGEKFIEKANEFNAEKLFDEKIYINNDVKLLLDEEGFEFKANIIEYDENNNYEYGMLTVLTDDLINNNIHSDFIEKLNNKNINYVDNKCEIIEEKNLLNHRKVYIKSSLTSLPYDKLNEDYTCIAYIKDGDEYLYSSGKLKVNLANLCSKELYLNNYDKEKLTRILNAATNYALDVEEANKYNEALIEIVSDEEITINYSNINKYKLTTSLNPNVGYFMKYESDNPNVLSIDENGIITTNSIGTATVNIYCGGVIKNINVNVTYGVINNVRFDAVVSENEYLGTTINKSNSKVYLSIKGQVIDGDAHLLFTFKHGSWSPYSTSWYNNDNIEFKLDNGKSHTVVFYDGVPSFSNGIKEGVATTVNENGKLLTTVELVVEGDKDEYSLKVGMNGTNIGWFGAIWEEEPYNHRVSITTNGITENINVHNKILLDGNLDEDIYTTAVKENTVSFTPNGASVELGGTLIDEGVILYVKVEHKVAPNTSFINGEWYSYMNIEFRFNNDTNTQYIATCNNHTSRDKLYSYCKTVEVDNGYESIYEIFVPYEVIGVSNTVQSIDITCNGNFETGWCWMNNNTDWTSTHIVTKDGVFLKTN